LNTYSALIQDFYSEETAPYPAIHIVLNTGTEVGEEAGVKAYIRYSYLCCVLSTLLRFRSSPIGVFPKPENAVFVPITVTLRANDAERSGCASVSNFLTCQPP
jgi:translation initiation factor 3 subunit F